MGGLTRGRVRTASRVEGSRQRERPAPTAEPGCKSNSGARAICLQLAACKSVAWAYCFSRFLKIDKFVCNRTALSVSSIKNAAESSMYCFLAIVSREGYLA